MEQNIELIDKLNIIEGQMGEFWAKFAEFEQICGVNLDETLPRFCRNDQKSAKSAKKEPTKALLTGLAKQIEAVKNDLVPELELVINEKKLENAGVKSTKLLFELADLQMKT
ncbi:hypothetical protein niasHT_014951 [Heterodera trifolii]|uniref:Uncharacterized protein n=1 Tax=Heterodera trifolii TaxID=157864 RepID=A0ABD2LFP4_9BILA